MHSDCRTCEQHFLIEEAQQPYVTRKFVALDDEMAERWLFKTLGETKEHLHHVKGMISSHGDVILSRWKKFSQAKRAKLLNTAAPEILLSPLCEPADYITSLDPKIEVGHAAIPGRETNGFGHDYMKLLSLLYVRSECDPSQWAAFDTRSTQSLCSQSTWKQYLYNPRAVIMHGEQYGRLVDFDVNAAHGWQQAGFPRAILTLIVQQMIAETLSKAVCAIVADAEPTGHDKWTAMVSKGLRSAHQEALWSSYYHQEFTLPAQFEVDAILEKIRNRLNILTDETELMQTDPDYMRQCIAEARAQTFVRSEENGKPDQIWIKAGQVISVGATNGLVCWLAIEAETVHLKKILAETGSSTTPGAILTKDADAAMRCFGLSVLEMLKFLVYDEVVPTLQSLKSMQEFRLKGMGVDPEAYVFKKQLVEQPLDVGQKSQRIACYVQQMMVVLSETSEKYHLLACVQGLKHELQDVAYNNNAGNCLSSMALLDELHTLWSWRQVADHNEPPTRDALQRDITSRGICQNFAKLTNQQTLHFQRRLIKVQSECGRALRDFCELPVPKGPKNTRWLEKMTVVRERLATFWRCVRDHWEISQFPFCEGTEAFKTAIQSRTSFDVSLEYLSKIEAERRQIEDEDRHKQKLKAQQRSVAQFIQQPWDLGASKDVVVR